MMDVRFDPAPGLVVSPILAPPIAAATAGPGDGGGAEAAGRGGEAGSSGRDGGGAGEAGLGLGPGPLAGLIAGLQPLRASGGARNYLFRITRAPPARPAADAGAAQPRAAAVDVTNALGKLEIRWRGNMGEAGARPPRPHPAPLSGPPRRPAEALPES